MPKRLTQPKPGGDPSLGARALGARAHEPPPFREPFEAASPRDINPSAPALLTGLTALYGAYTKTRGA